MLRKKIQLYIYVDAVLIFAL